MAKRLIDPIYKKYASRVVSAVASTDFYEYFMEVISAGQNQYQFSNRHVEKSVDERWVIAVEDALHPMEEIINNPRNFIMTEEAIVNVALAKRITPDTVKHLAQHGDMIDSVTEDSVKPNRLMEKFKEDSWNTYENRFVYTLLEMAWDFVDKRYDAIFAALGDECGSHLRMSTDARSLNEHIKAEIDIRIQEEEDLLAADARSETIFARIARCHRILSTYRTTGFAKAMAKFGKIKPPLFPTNAIKKNPNFKACHKLWNFILSYNDIGYKIDIFEQSNEITDEFETDIKNSIMFDYIILKNYLQMKEDRVIDTTRAFKKKEIKPTYIREVIEEIVKNYDLPDVEVKKVLIEEINKAQLLKLEEEERLRLVAEKEKEMKAKRLQEEKEARKKAREAEREKLRQEKERLKELERQEKQKEAEVKRAERAEEKRLEEEGLWIEKIKGELEKFDTALDLKRNETAIKAAEDKKKEKLQREKEAEREKKKAALEKQKEKDRILREKEKEKAKAKAEREKVKAQEKAASDKMKARIAAGKTKIVTQILPEELPEPEAEVKAVKAAPAEEKKTAEAKKPAAVKEEKPVKKAAEAAAKAEKPAKKAAEAAETAEKPVEKKTEKAPKPKKTAEEKPVEKKPEEEKRVEEKPAEEITELYEEKEEEILTIPEVPEEEEPAASGPIHISTMPEEWQKEEKAVEEADAFRRQPAEDKPLVAEAPTPSQPMHKDAPIPGAFITSNDFGEKKPIGVTELGHDFTQEKGIKSIFKKIFK